MHTNVRTLQQRFLDLSPHVDWLILGCPGQRNFSSLGSCGSACCKCSSTDFWASVSGNSASSYLARVEPHICNSSKVRRYARQVLVTLFRGLNICEPPNPHTGTFYPESIRRYGKELSYVFSIFGTRLSLLPKVGEQGSPHFVFIPPT